MDEGYGGADERAQRLDPDRGDQRAPEGVGPHDFFHGTRITVGPQITRVVRRIGHPAHDIPDHDGGGEHEGAREPADRRFGFHVSRDREAEMLHGDHGEGEENEGQHVEEIFFCTLDQVMPDKGDGDLNDRNPDDADEEIAAQEILERVAADDGVDGEPGKAAEEIEERRKPVPELAEPVGALDHLRQAVIDPERAENRQQNAADDVGDENGKKGGRGRQPESTGGKRAGGERAKFDVRRHPETENRARAAMRLAQGHRFDAFFLDNAK